MHTWKNTNLKAISMQTGGIHVIVKRNGAKKVLVPYCGKKQCLQMSVREFHHSAGCSKQSQRGVGGWAVNDRPLLLSKGHMLSGLIQEYRGFQCFTSCLLQYVRINPPPVIWAIISVLLRRTTEEFIPPVF